MRKIKLIFNNGKIVLLVCAIFFGAVSLISWALPVLKFQKLEEIMVGAYLSDITGYQLAFGGIVYRYSSSPYPPVGLELNICPLATVSIVSLILGLILCLVSFSFLIRKKNCLAWKITVIASAVLFIAGGILCFFLEESFKMSSQNKDISFFKTRMLSNYNVCPFCGIVAITSGILTGLQVIYFKKKEIK